MRTISHEFARRSDFVTALVEKLSLEIYINGNTVFRTGEKANELFIIYSGEVELLTADLVKFKTVSDCTLGESGFFRREQHICDARATKTTEVSWSEALAGGLRRGSREGICLATCRGLSAASCCWRCSGTYCPKLSF